MYTVAADARRAAVVPLAATVGPDQGPFRAGFELLFFFCLLFD